MQKYIHIIVMLLLSGWCIKASCSEGTEPDIQTFRSAIYATLLNDTSTLARLVNQSKDNTWFKDDLLLLNFATTLHLAGEEHLPILTLNLHRQSSTPEGKTLARYLGAQHDLVQIKRLKKEILYQKSASIFNYISSTISELLNGRTAVLGQIAVDSIYFPFKSRGITPRIRKLHFLTQRVLQKGWTLSDKEKSKLLRIRGRIAEQKRKLELKKNLRAVRIYFKRGDFNTAGFYLRLAQELSSDSENKSVRKWQWKIASAQGKYDRRLLADVWVKDSFLSSASSPDRQRISVLLSSLLANDRESYSLARLELEKYLKKQNLGTLGFCDAALLFQDCNWQKGTENLTALIRNFPQSTEANLSRGLLLSEYISPYRHFSEARGEYRKQLWRYILTGERQLDEQAYIATSLAVHEARSFASGLGVFILFDVGIRGMTSIWRSPINPDELKDAGVKFIQRSRKHNLSQKQVKKTAKWLAKIYYKERAYTLAQYYYDIAGILTPERREKLRDKSARELLRVAMDDQNLSRKKQILESIIQTYGDTKSAKKAEKELDKTIKEEQVLCRVDFELLKFNPQLIHCLNITPELVDGRKSNGEINSSGVTVFKDGRFQFVDKKTGMSLSGDLEEERFLRFKHLWKEILHTRENHRYALESLRRRKFPVEIVGAVGAEGFDLFPRLLPLPPDPTLRLFK